MPGRGSVAAGRLEAPGYGSSHIAGLGKLSAGAHRYPRAQLGTARRFGVGRSLYADLLPFFGRASLLGVEGQMVDYQQRGDHRRIDIFGPWLSNSWAVDHLR